LIFAKIDFINLLPFYIFLKRNIKSSQTKAIINYKKSYPSKINILFKKRKIHGAFISSIVSQNCNCLDIGIVAKKNVTSVISINGDYQKDYQSNTSNILAQVLNINGKVLIGDRALDYYYNDKNKDFQDLAQVWNEKYNLPFVFARLCFVKKNQYFNDLAKKFLRQKIKIPQYILTKYAKRGKLSKKQILDYLNKISYEINYKEKQSLKLFFKLAKNLNKE
jgi:chorismate dehydratase